MSIYLVNLLIFVVILILTWFGRRKQIFSIFSDNRIPGPKPSFWTGNLKELIRSKETFEYQNSKKYGNIFGYFLGAKPILVITDPELIKIIQIKNFKNFSNKDFLLSDANIPHHIGMKSLPVRTDKHWIASRIILNSCFSSKNIKLIFHHFNEAIDEFLKNIEKESRNKLPIDIYPHFRKLTLDIMCRTVFGIKSEIQKGKNSLFLEYLEKMPNINSPEISTLLSVCFPEIKHTPKLIRRINDYARNVFGYPSVKLLVNTLQEIIHLRKISSSKTEDLLQCMIDGKIETKVLSNVKEEDLDANKDNSEEADKFTNVRNSHTRLSTDEVTGNALIFVAIGYGTTSSILAYASYYLATFLEVQEKAAKQIKMNLKDAQIQYEDLAKFDYLDQIISETLRLHPVSSLSINRKVKNSFKYKGKTIHEDMIITIPPRLLHRNPKYWSEPDKFNPERFSVENKKHINSTIYQPFGNGPRNCIGMRFAQILIKIILARLLMKFQLEKPSNYVLECNHSLFESKPKEVIVHLTPINN